MPTTLSPISFLSRRDWLRIAGGSFAASAVQSFRPRVARSDGISDQYAGLNSDQWLGQVEVVARVDDDKVFTEGPACDSQGTVYFTNVPMSKILTWNPKSRQLRVFREKSQESNGLCFDAQGRLLACEGGARRVTRTDMKTGQVSVLADSFNGFPLAAPNDLCTDRRSRIYFTSRPGVDDPTQGNVNAVYRMDLDGRVDQILRWPDIHMPNGIAISPDDKTLYLIESHPESAHHRDLRAYDLNDDGSAANGRVLIDFYPGRGGDGMCIDSEGNLYVAAGLHKRRGTSETLDTRPGIHVISPLGKLLAFRETPADTITNCAFGGADRKTLYVTCGSLLLSIPTKISGRA